MNCSAHICSTGSRMKTWKMIIVSLKISFVDCNKVSFDRFVNNDLLQILWTYVNFLTEQAIWRKCSVTQNKKYMHYNPFSWVVWSKNSNFSPIFFYFKTNICFIKNWLLTIWQGTLINNVTNLQVILVVEESGSNNVFDVPVNNSCFSMLLFSAVFVFKMN